MSAGWESVASFSTLVEAEIAAGRLEAADIPFFIDQRDAVGIFGPGHSGTSVRGVDLKVPADFLDEARAQLDLDPNPGEDADPRDDTERGE